MLQASNLPQSDVKPCGLKDTEAQGRAGLVCCIQSVQICLCWILALCEYARVLESSSDGVAIHCAKLQVYKSCFDDCALLPPKQPCCHKQASQHVCSQIFNRDSTWPQLKEIGSLLCNSCCNPSSQCQVQAIPLNTSWRLCSARNHIRQCSDCCTRQQVSQFVKS